MPISITCSACGKRLKAGDHLAGRRLPCPACGEKVLVPESEEDAASYLLQSEEEQPRERGSPALVEKEGDDEPSEEESPRRPAAPAGRRRNDVASLPPLTANETQGWLRHLHWLLALALLPLAFSLLSGQDDEADFRARLVKTVVESPPEVRPQAEEVLLEYEAELISPEEAVEKLLEKKLAGALLPRDTLVHWGFAALAAVLFLVFFAFLAAHQKAAEPLHLLGIGLFTATIGIVLLLLLQSLAAATQGVWVAGSGPAVIVFYVLKVVGFLYGAALLPEYGFFLSLLGFTLAVGLCEEVVKALPLLWHYRRPSGQTWRGALLWGLASGAGFGIGEGVMFAANYYNGIHGGDVYAVRFLSCVALHAVWTGSVGITVHRHHGMIQQVLSWYEFIPRVVFFVGIPMLLHGLYDTFLKKEMNAAALGVAALSFLFLAYQISRLHGETDEEGKQAMLREYKRRREAMS
jgi:RsiW-degrading membrane proteinase PrsW (M82 family)